MEAELVALATSGATTLVGLMVSETWTQARERLAGFLGGRGTPVEAELDISREELMAAQESGDEEAAADVAAGWRQRLRRLLRENPGAAPALRALLDELAPQAGSSAGSVHNSITGGVQHGTVIQGRDFSGGLTFNATGDPSAH